MPTITAHCLVKNEENFVEYALRSVVDVVDSIIVFDTGSTDATVAKIQKVQREYPDKIVFEEKGAVDKQGHTKLRQEMLERTTTEWFMILDGDEVWTKRALAEAVEIIRAGGPLECLVAPFYACVGDVYHEHKAPGKYTIFSKRGNFTPRFLKRARGLHWVGEYDHDTLVDGEGKVLYNEHTTQFLHHKFWHLTHLRRSSEVDVYSSGVVRKYKEIPTFTLIGRKITEPVPEVFLKESEKFTLHNAKSINNFFIWIIRKLTRSFGAKLPTIPLSNTKEI